MQVFLVKAEEGRRQGILGMEDGQELQPDGVLSVRQRDHIVEEYQLLPGPERMLFVLGFNRYMASLAMELTLCVKEVEEVDQGWVQTAGEGAGEESQDEHSSRSTAGEDRQEEEETATMQQGMFNKQLLRPSQGVSRAGKFGML